MIRALVPAMGVGASILIGALCAPPAESGGLPRDEARLEEIDRLEREGATLRTVEGDPPSDEPPTPRLVAEPVRGSSPFPFRKVRFRLSGLLGKVAGELALLPAEEVEAGPLAEARRALGRTPRGWFSLLTTSFEPRMLADKETESHAWFDPSSGAVSYFTKLTIGEDSDYKAYRLTREGAHRTRVERQRGDPKRDRKAWNNVVYGPGSGVHRSGDGGRTWRRLAGGLPRGDDVGRIVAFSWDEERFARQPD